MESRITKKVDGLVTQFKEDIKTWFNENNTDVSGECSKSDFLKFIFDHNTGTLTKDDFTRRKRVKNVVASQIRCCAKRANGEQCTRRKKEDCDFCGTHVKGTPYGKVNNGVSEHSHIKKREIWVQDIKGIQYFIDSNYNVYNHNDILQNKTSPEVIGKYTKTDDGLYAIPDFELN